MKYLFSSFLFLLISCLSFSQDITKTDSLKRLLKNTKDKAFVLNELSNEYITILPEEALRYAETAIKESVQEKNLPQLAEALRNCAMAHQALNEYDKCVNFADSAMVIYRETKNEAGMIRCQELKASTYMLQGNFNKALVLLQKGAESAKQINDLYTYGGILIQIGRIYMVKGNLDEALAVYSEAMEVAEKIDNRYLKGHIYHFTGMVYQNQQKFELAIENYLKALPIFEEENIITQIPYLLVSLGSALRETKNYGEALRYYMDALTYYTRSNDRWGLVELFRSIGSVYIEKNVLDSAWIYMEKSLHLSEELNEKSSECNALNKLGEILIYQKRYTEALEYLNRSLALNSEIESNSQLVDIMYNTGNCYVLMGNISEGLGILKKGLTLADSLNFKYDKMILNKEISNAYAELGDDTRALQHFRVYAELRDSIYQEAAHRNLVEMEQKYQSEKQKSEISQLKLDRAGQEITIRKQKSVRNIFVLGFLFAAMTGYLFYRSYLTKRKADREKEVLLKEIHHRVKNNLQIISSLLSIQSEYVADNKIAGAVMESQSRVQAMALIHQLLYQEENLTKINFSDYLQQLTSNLASIFQIPGSRVDVSIDAPEYWFTIETSIPLGLIVTELVSNAFKYAFNPGTEGKINISLSTATEGKYSLTISDNGKGLPDGTDIFQSNSMGLKLANILTGQLKGQLHYKNDHGAVFILEFLENKPPVK